MKTFFTLLTSLFMSIAVFAAAKPQSILTIKSADNSDIRVVLDGKRFEPNDNSVMFRGIDDGYHTIKVFKQKRNGIFHLAGKKYDLVYNTSINLKKRTHLFITIERNGRISMQENKIKRDWDGQDEAWDNGRDRRNERDYDFDRDGQWGDYDNHEGYASGMNGREFKIVLQSIEKEWLESNKLKSASQIVRVNSLSTAQVEQLLLLFSFENNKLELAKQAYANTVDKRNYSRLLDVFSFNSSKVELERYIQRYR
ncbi:MAG TPA: DUF4476 domain-containing protein [Chitinophagaceae bacterium]|nr:DUF4476 domain-containing protein [Chitinophagaceae bacterium]